MLFVMRVSFFLYLFRNGSISENIADLRPSPIRLRPAGRRHYPLCSSWHCFQDGWHPAGLYNINFWVTPETWAIAFPLYSLSHPTAAFDIHDSTCSLLKQCRLLARTTTDGGKPGRTVPESWHPLDWSLLPSYKSGESPVRQWKRANENKVKTRKQLFIWLGFFLSINNFKAS